MVGASRRRMPALVFLSGCVCLFSVARFNAAPQDVPSSAEVAALIAEGQAIFGAECVTCHTADGAEDMGPALANNSRLASLSNVLTKILHGQKDMPAFEKTLTDRQVAAVATYIRASWDNKYGVVLEVDVKRVREDGPKKP